MFFPFQPINCSKKGFVWVGFGCRVPSSVYLLIKVAFIILEYILSRWLSTLNYGFFCQRYCLCIFLMQLLVSFLECSTLWFTRFSSVSMCNVSFLFWSFFFLLTKIKYVRTCVCLCMSLVNSDNVSSPYLKNYKKYSRMLLLSKRYSSARALFVCHLT